jgi:predicted PurR-regulated permease PerM
VLGIIIASIAAFIQFNSFNSVLLVWAVFAIGHSIDQIYLTPKLIGDSVGLHPVAVIFAVLAGGNLFGFVGVLLAIPASALIMVLIRYLHQQYHKSHLYKDKAK